ncbi:hypothetical protein [Nocardia sp. BMG51109]|uniref:DUF6968 family protein n=1 Tax=Nocardia sp. BMG51109 TaxID=1056816 RepID=UPI0004639188|nr:hypothetical protein [Nocardia sp. BMG51109]
MTDPIATRRYDDRHGQPVSLEFDRPRYDDDNDCWRCVFRITGLERGPEPYEAFGLGNDSLESLVVAQYIAESVLTSSRNDPPVTLDGNTDLGLPSNPHPPMSDTERAEIEALLSPPTD